MENTLKKILVTCCCFYSTLNAQQPAIPRTPNIPLTKTSEVRHDLYARLDNQHSVQAIPFDSSNLPIVYISTNWQFIQNEPKITADMHIIDHGYNMLNRVNDTDAWTYSGKIGIEKRGSISQLWPQNSYSVETRDTAGNALNVSLLGMPSENDWILYGPYDDVTLARNVMTYELAREMGYWAPRTKYVEVVINTWGWPVYQGVYVLMEKIKRDNNRVSISRLDSIDNAGDQLTGGYIIAIDRNIWTGDSGFVSSQPQNLFFAYKYPDYAHITQPQIDYIKSYVDSFETALLAPNFDDLNNGFRKYAYDATFMDFFFFQEMSNNFDSYKRSAYLFKDKYSSGGKLHAGPLWDFNSAWFNVHLCGFDSVSGWAYENPCWLTATTPFWYDRMLQDSIFARDLHCRWIEWRNTVLDTANMFHILDSITNYVGPAAARQDSNYNITETLPGQMDTLKMWIRGRLAWMDANMPGNCWNLGVADGNPEQDVFAVYPNPSRDDITVSFTLSSPQTISIELLDSYGRRLKIITPQEYSAGPQSISIDISMLPSGTYFVNMITSESSVTKKVLKLD